MSKPSIQGANRVYYYDEVTQTLIQSPNRPYIYRIASTVEREKEALEGKLSISASLHSTEDNVPNDVIEIELAVNRYLGDEKVGHLNIETFLHPGQKNLGSIASLGNWLYKLKDTIGTSLFLGSNDKPHEKAFVTRLLIALADQTESWDEELKKEFWLRKNFITERRRAA